MKVFIIIFFLRVALTGPRSVAISGLHPCSHWPLFAIAPTHEWIGILRVYCNVHHNHTIYLKCKEKVLHYLNLLKVQSN